jgi:antitoxin (DNA-binding transcriptional repressor) of toxin-antitoxin stability system
MKFVSLRDLREKSGEVWKALPIKGQMVITRRGRPVAILVAVNESNLEESLAALRRARTVEAVASLQQWSVKQGTHRISMEEIDAEIKEVRRKRSR